MIAFLDTNKLTECEQELQIPCEQLLTPLTKYRRVKSNSIFAVDNGAFSGFDKKAFHSLLKREYENRELCKFVAVPDVISDGVGNARRTLEVFEDYRHELDGWHWSPKTDYRICR